MIPHQLAASIRPTLTQRVTIAPDLVCPASIREHPQSRAQQQYGLDDVRLADLLLLREDLYGAAIVRDLQITVVSGPQAGPWFVLEPLGQDDVCVVVRLRRSVRHSSAAPGSTTMR